MSLDLSGRDDAIVCQPIKIDIPKEHPLIKLANMLHWSALLLGCGVNRTYEHLADYDLERIDHLWHSSFFHSIVWQDRSAFLVGTGLAFCSACCSFGDYFSRAIDACRFSEHLLEQSAPPGRAFSWICSLANKECCTYNRCRYGSFVNFSGSNIGDFIIMEND